MNTQMILDYLAELSANNNREWYHAHKAQYQAANAQFEELIQNLISRIGEFDGSVLGHTPRELTFKLVRDTRFSHDKSPYNPAFRAHISAMGKLPIRFPFFQKKAAALKFVISKPPQAKCFANTRKKSSAYPNGFFFPRSGQMLSFNKNIFSCNVSGRL